MYDGKSNRLYNTSFRHSQGTRQSLGECPCSRPAAYEQKVTPTITLAPVSRSAGIQGSGRTRIGEISERYDDELNGGRTPVKMVPDPVVGRPVTSFDRDQILNQIRRMIS